MRQATPNPAATTMPLTPHPLPTIVGGEHVVMIVPHEEGLRQAGAMETWFQACSSDSPFALELVGTKKEQGCVLRASSADQLVLLCKQFEAQYPQAEIERIAPSADPLILRPGEHAIIGEFALSAPSWMPLKTFTGKALAETGADPLAGILAAMEAVGSGERVICQLALVRAPESWIARDIRKAVEHPLQDERDQAAMHSRGMNDNPNAGGLKILVGLFGGLAALYGYHWYQQHLWLPLVLLAALAMIVAVGLGIWWFFRRENHIYDMKMVAEKLLRAAFYTQLRVIVIGKESTSTEKRLHTLLSHMEISYRQFTLASANGLYVKRVRHLTPSDKGARTLPSPLHAFPYAHPLLRFLHGAPCKDVWNGLELSGPFHLPQETADLPLMRRLSVKHLLFSPEVAHKVATTASTLPPTLLGYSKHRGHVIPALVPFSTLFSHKFLIGRTRSGKTVLMQRMIQGAMQRVTDGTLQPGIFVIDPHYDLVEDLLSLIPAERFADVLLLDFTDTNFPIGLNPLDATMGFTRDQAVSNLMSCFEGVWKEYWGPRMSYFLKSVCLLLYTLNADLVKAGHPDKQYTILDINPLLQYQDYAIQVLGKLDMSETWHQELLAWWQNVYFALPKQSSFRQEVIMPILTKIGTFNDNQVLRRIVGQPVTTAPIHESVTQGKIVLCALSSRDLDDASVNILGSTLINLLHRSFSTQQHIPLMKRRKVFVAVDELQNFTGSMFDKLLTEDAKFGCAMLLSTQNLKRLNQIKEGLLEIVLSSCENLCAFNVSAADAKILEEELQERVSQKHIISQPRLHCYARLAFADHPLQFASVQVAPPASWSKDTSQQARISSIRKRSRARVLSLAAVDALHTSHLKEFLDVSQFAEKIRKEGQARQEKKQEREDGNQLAIHAQNNSIAPRSLQHSTSKGSATPPVPTQQQSIWSPQDARSVVSTPAKDAHAKHQQTPAPVKETATAVPHVPSSAPLPLSGNETVLASPTITAGETSTPAEGNDSKKNRSNHNRSSRRVQRWTPEATAAPDGAEKTQHEARIGDQILTTRFDLDASEQKLMGDEDQKEE